MSFHKAAIFMVDDDNEIRMCLEDNRVMVNLVNRKSLQFLSPDIAASVQECLTKTLESSIAFYYTGYGKQIDPQEVSNKITIEVGVVCNNSVCLLNLNDASQGTEWTCTTGNRNHKKKYPMYWFFDRKQRECQQMCRGLDTTELQTIPSNKHLVRLASKFGISLFGDFIIHMGLETQEYCNIQHQYEANGVHSVMFMALVKCMKDIEAKLKRPSLKPIRDALIAVDLNQHVLYVSEIRLQSTVDDDVLTELPKHIGNCVIHLGIELGLTVEDIEATMYNYPKDMYSQIASVLRIWKRSSQTPTVFALLKALQHVKSGGLSYLCQRGNKFNICASNVTRDYQYRVSKSCLRKEKNEPTSGDMAVECAITLCERKFLKHYLDTHNNPEIICVQETRFKDNRYIKLQGYHPPIIRNRKIPIQPKGKNKNKPQIGGGVAIYVSIQVNFSQLNFNTDNIEVVGVSVNCQNNKINIVNVYRPPNQDIKFKEYQVLHNLSDNIVLLGDFNRRSSMWGSSTTDSNGNIIEKVIDQNNMIILNDGTGTYQTVTGNRTQIDLTLVSASLANDSQWSVLDEQLGSDHFPVLTVLNAKPVRNKVCTPQRWVYDKADWHRFTTLCNEINIDNIKHDSIEICNQNFCEVVTKSQMKQSQKVVVQYIQEKTVPGGTMIVQMPKKISVINIEYMINQNQKKIMNYIKLQSRSLNVSQIRQKLTTGKISVTN
ncbi:unnamed protein product [Mytilus edulis]|uniref:Death domain-containing protein n=1 Tax=Mytilus edulis TaxID=6550 RepID=A0A8S3QXA4_MYTED|nr:unnamed protein product [Mytilus edulis]